MMSRITNIGLSIMPYFNVVGRLRSEATVSQAQANLSSIIAPTMRGAPKALLVAGFLSDRRNREGPVLGLLAGVGLSILLISVTNTGTLLLMRALGQRREIAIRCALGATKAHILRQWLYEGLALCVISGGMGAAMQTLAKEALLSRAPNALSEHFGLKLPVHQLILNALAISAITVLLAQLAPVWHTLRQNIADVARHESGTSSASRFAVRARGFLLGGEVALTVCLMVLAALLLKTVFVVLHMSSGLDSRGAFLVKVVMTGPRYGNVSAQSTLASNLIARLKSLPGHPTTGSITFFPVPDESYTVPVWMDRSTTGPALSDVDLVGVSGEYFAASGTQLLSGRPFGAMDIRDTTAVAIIDEGLARRLGGPLSAIGKHIEAEGVVREVIGVARAVRYRGVLGKDPNFLFYVPLEQSRMPFPYITFVVRVNGDMADTMNSVRALFAQVDPTVSLNEMSSIPEVLSASLRREEFALTLFGALGATGYLFAMVGIYAITSYMALQARRETAIRLALGAPGGHVRLHVTGGVAVLLVSGTVSGLVAAALCARLLSTLSFGFSTSDTLVYASSAASVLTIGALAAYLPTRHIDRLPIADLLRTL